MDFLQIAIIFKLQGPKICSPVSAFATAKKINEENHSRQRKTNNQGCPNSDYYISSHCPASSYDKIASDFIPVNIFSSA